ncbi:hypothetical protein KKF32_00465 [Patescibacteria group bacterium]|nr:hypothetical protein [Patescibacteria group bacterium]
MKTIFLFVSSEVYTSDLLRTEYIKYLSSKYIVVVLLPFSKSEIDSLNYYQQSNIIYISWPTESRFWLTMKSLRLLMINEFDYLKNTTALVQRKNYAYRLGFRGKFAYYFFRLLTKLGIKITANFCTKLELLFAPTKSSLFDNLLKRYNPRALLTATPGFMRNEAELIILAKRKKITTAAINFSWDNLSSKASRMRKVDYMIVWNNLMREEALNIHRYQPENIFVSGSARFDHYFKEDPKEVTREEFLKSKGLDPANKTILFSTCSPGVFAENKEVIQNILNWRLENKLVNYSNLYIRLHPKDLQDYQKFKGMKNVFIEKGFTSYQREGTDKKLLEMSEGDLMNLKYTFKYCDLNINCASTISLEACAFDLPVINIFIGHYYGRYHYKPIVDSGAVKLVDYNQELLEAINTYLKNPEEEKSERRRLMERYIQLTDNLSYKRNVDFLTKIIN